MPGAVRVHRLRVGRRGGSVVGSHPFEKSRSSPIFMISWTVRSNGQFCTVLPVSSSFLSDSDGAHRANTTLRRRVVECVEVFNLEHVGGPQVERGEAGRSRSRGLNGSVRFDQTVECSRFVEGVTDGHRQHVATGSLQCRHLFDRPSVRGRPFSSSGGPVATSCTDRVRVAVGDEHHQRHCDRSRAGRNRHQRRSRRRPLRRAPVPSW